MRDHTSLELKKKDNNESYKIVSFGQGFEKRFVASLMEFAFFFNVFFYHFIGVFDYSVRRSMLSRNHEQRQTTFSDTKLFFARIIVI